MKNLSIQQRVTSMRTFLKSHNLSAFIVPSTDPHSGEYVPEYWESRKWISGFNGSAGTVVITNDKAGLWTDSRYFLQAEEELRGTGIELFKENTPDTPSISKWLTEILHSGDNVGIDGSVNSISSAFSLINELQTSGIHVVSTSDPFVGLWKERPSLPLNKAFILPVEYSGESCSSKIERIKDAYKKNNADGILISALDEIAWVLNMRGSDIHCNPVFISYLLITDYESVLFISKEKLDKEDLNYLSENDIKIAPYESIADHLKSLPIKRLQMSEQTNYMLYLTAQAYFQVLLHSSPVLHMKSVKNKVEIQGFHNAMIRDGVAMTRFIMWLKDIASTHSENEFSIDQKLYSIRAQQEGFYSTSFDTIAGYQSHGAIVHYEATQESAFKILDSGLLLLDSGAQYRDGTTDITRTIILGPLTQEQKRDYTLVLKGMIGLAMAEFPHGTCGTQIDALARMPMWKYGINYGHGTGHGVGHFLNVHEGPHQIRMNHMPAILLPGMTVTDEPGIYRQGKYGIRIENTMLVIPSRETEFGKFYKFEQLTLCPIDKEGIIVEMLNNDEREWLNNYHEEVFKKLSPFVTGTEYEWLKQVTSKL